MKPLALVSTATPPMLAVFRPPAAAAAGLLLLPPAEEVPEEVPDELHAARTTAAAAAASSTLAWLRVSSQVCDLIIAYSLVTVRPGPCAGGTLTIPPCNRRCRASGSGHISAAPDQRPSQRPVRRLTARSFHWFAAGKSSSGAPSLTPGLPEVYAACFGAEAVCAHALTGMRPMRRQVPPSSGSRLMHATLALS